MRVSNSNTHRIIASNTHLIKNARSKPVLSVAKEGFNFEEKEEDRKRQRKQTLKKVQIVSKSIICKAA